MGLLSWGHVSTKPNPEAKLRRSSGKENATPKVQKLADPRERYSYSVPYDVTVGDDGSTIAVGGSILSDGTQIATRWTNLSVENLNFTS